MNSNLNRQRSPIQKNPPLPNTKPVFFNVTSYTKNCVQKTEVANSADTSTNADQRSSQPSLIKQGQPTGNNSSNFTKTKIEQSASFKQQNNLTYLKNSNSQKLINYKVEKKLEVFQNKSPEKFEEYFGFKNYIQKKAKNQNKIHSESNDSEVSHNSSQSNSIQNSKSLKFLSKKNQKNNFQQPTIKFGRFQEQRQQRQRKYSPLILQGKLQLNKKFSIQNFNEKNQFLHPSLTPRKQQTPVHHICQSPPKRQEGSVSGNQQQIYKRSSLSPQNKLTICKPQNQDQSGARNPTPSKNSNYNTAQKQYNDRFNNEQQKSPKIVSYYPTLKKDKKNQNDSCNFSFSKQRSIKNHTSSPNINTKPILKGLLSIQTITVYPLSYHSSNATSFILLQRLAHSQNNNIYKCLHAPTYMIYCLKKSKVTVNNRNQLITQHKVSVHLEHPNIVRTYASFYDKNHLYLLMQYMDGQSLINRNQSHPFVPKNIKEYQQQSFISSKNPQNVKINNRLSFNDPHRIRQTVSVKNLQKSRHSNLHTLSYSLIQKNKNKIERLNHIRYVIEQILYGLQYLHEKNIIHRDLKPDNIFVSHDLCYKIGDFGSCTYTGSQEYIGTLDYAAPEIMQKTIYDKSLDMWSLGCIAYQLDVGRPPFYHEKGEETVQRIINVQYDSSCISDQNLKKFINRLLVKNGQARMSVQEALLIIQLLQSRPQNSYEVEETANNNGCGQFFNKAQYKSQYINPPPPQPNYSTVQKQASNNSNTGSNNNNSNNNNSNSNYNNNNNNYNNNNYNNLMQQNSQYNEYNSIYFGNSNPVFIPAPNSNPYSNCNSNPNFNPNPMPNLQPNNPNYNYNYNYSRPNIDNSSFTTTDASLPGHGTARQRFHR